MTTKSAQRVDEIRERVNKLEAKANAAGAETKESMQGRIAALRQQEASARAAVRERADAADAKVDELGTRLRAAEDGLAADLAENRDDFRERMQAYLDDVDQLDHKLEARAKELQGAARSDADARIADLQRSREKVAARFAEQRDAAGERWREGRQSVAAARAELERNADEALKKLG
jgi:colicin import membrane protein